LKGRQTESASDLAVRVKAAEDEFAQVPMFDYTVISHSNDIERAVADIQRIILGERCRPVTQQSRDI
jgi:guanylate kinase